MTYYTRGFDMDPGDTARESDLETEFDSIATGFASVEGGIDDTITFTNADFTGQTSAANATTRGGKVMGFDSSGDFELKNGYDTVVADAETAQAAAEAAQAAAEAAQAAAEASETAAAASEAAAASSETNAGTAETGAVAAQGYAEEWANKAEDSLVSVAAGGDGATEYSALHWAAKAADSASAAAQTYTIVTSTDSPFSMSVGGLYSFDLSGGAITATLPSVGVSDDGKRICWVVDANASTSNLTITPSDTDTVAGETSVEVDLNHTSGVFVYDDTNTNWSI